MLTGPGNPVSPLIRQLMDALRCLPGVGNKTAQRMAYHLLERDREGGRQLAQVLPERCRTSGAAATAARCVRAERCAPLHQ